MDANSRLAADCACRLGACLPPGTDLAALARYLRARAEELERWRGNRGFGREEEEAVST